MFILKKIIPLFISPVPLCLELLIAGLILLLFTRRQKTGKLIISIGVILFAIMSFTPIPDLLIKPLERKYPPLYVKTSDTNLDDISSIKWIVVLGGGHVPDPNTPISSQISGATLVRLTEAIRLYKKIPGSKLILSEGKVFNPVAGAETMAKVARAVGINQEDLILESESMDTDDEARLIKPIVGEDKFILVTSAAHMPRSMALFKKKGMNPIPAPTDHCYKNIKTTHPSDFFPNPGGLIKTETALHEYLGIIWSKLRGDI